MAGLDSRIGQSVVSNRPRIESGLVVPSLEQRLAGYVSAALDKIARLVTTRRLGVFRDRPFINHTGSSNLKVQLMSYVEGFNFFRLAAMVYPMC